MNSLTIGQVAKQAGVAVETIRYYEREGLLSMPPRHESGYRAYSGEAVAQLRFILSAKALGFSLKEIKELLNLRIAPGTSCETVKEHAQSKIGGIDAKIRNLQRMKRALKRLTDACDGRGSVAQCPILDALDEGDAS